MGENWKNLKTTQGMALRACGAGFSVGFYNFGQNLDGMLELASRLPGLHILENVRQDVAQLDMIFLHNCDLAQQSDLEKFLNSRPKDTEIVLCGTTFSDNVLAMADLVSEVVTTK